MYLISELSVLSGIPVKIIQYYEKYGLIKAAQNVKPSKSRLNVYDEETLERLEIIEEGKSIGFSLSELQTFLKAWYGSRSNQEKRVKLLREKLHILDEKSKKIEDVKSRLELLLQEIEKFS